LKAYDIDSKLILWIEDFFVQPKTTNRSKWVFFSVVYTVSSGIP